MSVPPGCCLGKGKVLLFLLTLSLLPARARCTTIGSINFKQSLTIQVKGLYRAGRAWLSQVWRLSPSPPIRDLVRDYSRWVRDRRKTTPGQTRPRSALIQVIMLAMPRSNETNERSAVQRSHSLRASPRDVLFSARNLNLRRDKLSSVGT